MPPLSVPYGPLKDFSDEIELQNMTTPASPEEVGSRVRQVLWLPITIAIFLFVLNLSVAILGLLTYHSRGPLYHAVIPRDRVGGRYITIPNIAAAISASVSLFTIGVGVVFAGLSRAWLWRRTSAGDGVVIRRWRAAASGGFSLHLLRSPMFFAGQVTLAALIARSLMAPAFQGILVPVFKEATTSYTQPAPPGFSGNAGLRLDGCVKSSTTAIDSLTGEPLMYCYIDQGYDDIATSMMDVWNGTEVGSDPEAPYEYVVDGRVVLSSDTSPLASPMPGSGRPQFLASSPNALYAPPGRPQLVDGEYYIFDTIGASITPKCTALGASNTSIAYSYLSGCLASSVSFGNASDPIGTYSLARSCLRNDTYVFEYALAGRDLPATTNWSYDWNGTFAISCNITAMEGRLEAALSASYYAFSISYFEAIRPLLATEIAIFAADVLAAVERDTVFGRLGKISWAMGRTRNSSGGLDLLLVERLVGKGFASAAASNYNRLQYIDGDVARLIDTAEVHHIVEGYGWQPRQGLLAWALVSLSGACVWLGAAGYMLKGGTAYDPTDWYQTVNTIAGSELKQVPGTCSGNGLDGADVAGKTLWYGETGYRRVGMSERETERVNRWQTYG